MVGYVMIKLFVGRVESVNKGRNIHIAQITGKPNLDLMKLSLEATVNTSFDDHVLFGDARIVKHLQTLSFHVVEEIFDD